jgi:hypothetical protein
MLDSRGINISIDIVLFVGIDIDSVGLEESVFEAFIEVSFVGRGQFDFAMVCSFEELPKALDYFICVIEVIFYPLCLDSRIEEGS